MNLWLREIFGWVLVALGLFVFYICLGFLTSPTQPRFLESGPLAFIGFVVFRGGIHLLKVSMAARVCFYARKMREQATAPVRQAQDPRATRLRASRAGTGIGQAPG